MTTPVAAACLLLFLAAPGFGAPVRLPRSPVQVHLSTVSAPARERINRQVGRDGEYVVKDASLQKSAIGAGYTLIPLPAFTYNRNEGAWTGALTPLFRANEKGQVEDIIAPLYLHNDLIGETFTLNYFGYRTGTKQFHAVISHATRVERAVDLSYKDIAVGAQGRYIVFAQLNGGKSAFNRFYGFGNQAADRMETNYALGDSNARLSAGINLNDDWALLATERYRRVTIENGVVSTLPQTKELFSNAPGINGADIWAHGVGVQYDTRDNQLTPLKGTYATASYEYDQNVKGGNHVDWNRITMEARNFWPHFKDRAVFVSHAVFDAMPMDSRGIVRNGVPFYERPCLGGETTLRAFGRQRFISSYAMLVNLEERFSLVSRSILGNVIELEAAPFVDVGRVARAVSFGDAFIDTQVNPGFGLRVLARPNIASRLDVGTGKDGLAIFVGLDYPF